MGVAQSSLLKGTAVNDQSFKNQVQSTKVQNVPQWHLNTRTDDLNDFDGIFDGKKI